MFPRGEQKVGNASKADRKGEFERECKEVNIIILYYYIDLFTF